MTIPERLRERARRRLADIHRDARDPRFVRVMGRFVQEGLLVSNRDVPRHTKRVRVADVLFAGSVEPRLFELLPALLVKRPGLFEDVTKLPADLAGAVRALRRNQEPPDFHGIPGREVHRWLTRVGRKGKTPSRLKSFRFTPEDQRLLERLASELGLSETDVIRKALRALL